MKCESFVLGILCLYQLSAGRTLRHSYSRLVTSFTSFARRDQHTGHLRGGLGVADGSVKGCDANDLDKYLEDGSTTDYEAKRYEAEDMLPPWHPDLDGRHPVIGWTLHRN